jgi:putative nucleotidyltransferase-like protein
VIDVPAVRLRSLCRSYVVGTAPVPPRLPDARHLLALARRHQLTPLLWSLLHRELAPDEPLAVALRRDAYRSVVRHQQLLSMVTPLVNALASEHVPVIALKGLMLGARYYADPADRPMRDVDLLVRREHVETILHAAADLGLHRFDDRHGLAFDLRFGSALVLTPTPADDSRPSIDVHWGLFVDGTVGTEPAPPLDQIWERATRLDIAGMRLLAMDPEDMLLHLAAHLAIHHAFGGLLWYCDLALMLRDPHTGLDWNAIIARAEQLRLRGVLSLVLDAVSELFGVRVPVEVTRWLRPQAPRWAIARRLVLRRALRLEPVHRFEHLVPLLLMDRGRDCVRTFAGALAPGPEWVTLRYGARWPLAYARHAANVLGVLRRSVALA